MQGIHKVPSDNHIEYYIKSATICGGIINGRTFWESLLCGKEVLEYTIDRNGNILKISDGKDYDTNNVKNFLVKKQIMDIL